jgi:predicted nucleotidyltransferase
MDVRDYFQRLQENLLDACVEFYGDRLKGLLIFGSVARDTMTPDSDLDFLLLVDPLPNGRWQRAREFDAVEERIQPLLDELDSVGIWGGLSPLFRTPEEFRQGSLVMLDMVDEARILHDPEGLVVQGLSNFGERMKRNGARRIRSGMTWHWDIKPDAKPGERITL